MLLKSLNITAAKAAESLERIDKVLEHVGSLLADGRPYLGLEVRQDLIATAQGQAEWAERLARIANQVAVAIT